MKNHTQVTYPGSVLAYRCANFRIIHRAITRMQSAVLEQCSNVRTLRTSPKNDSGNRLH